MNNSIFEQVKKGAQQVEDVFKQTKSSSINPKSLLESTVFNQIVINNYNIVSDVKKADGMSCQS